MMRQQLVFLALVCATTCAGPCFTNSFSSVNEPLDRIPRNVRLDGYWSGRSYWDDGSTCTQPCFYESRMRINHAGGSMVTGWYRARANALTDETSFTGTVNYYGDTLSIVVNSAQMPWTGPMKFSISANGRSLVARQDKKQIYLSLEE